MPRTSRKKPGLVDTGPVIPNRWVRFLVEWNWNNPDTRIPGRATKCFPAGVEIRLTRRQWESATSAGVAISITNPRHAGQAE